MMIDVKLSNGDVVADSTGRFVQVSDNDALFQRALICIGAKLGSFIYDRNLGSDVSKVELSDTYTDQKAELIVNEAIAQFENTYAKVIEYGDTLKLELEIGNESRIEEVHLNGNV